MDYNSFLSELYSYQDLKYKSFHSKLIKEDINIIGVRTPILKKLAKELAKNNGFNYIKECTHNTYEECVIHGLIIGYMKTSFNTKLELLDDFLKYNDNWATNDIVCANIKDFKKNKELGFNWIKELLKSNNTYDIRFSLTLLLDYYLVGDYIDEVFDIINSIKSDEYYIRMANAWLISVCYIKYKDLTKKFLESTKIDNFTYNKAISKICDSKRVSILEKEELKKLKK